MDKPDLHKVVFVKTTEGDIPYFRATTYKVKDGFITFYNEFEEAGHYNINFVISFVFSTR